MDILWATVMIAGTLIALVSFFYWIFRSKRQWVKSTRDQLRAWRDGLWRKVKTSKKRVRIFWRRIKRKRKINLKLRQEAQKKAEQEHKRREAIRQRALRIHKIRKKRNLKRKNGLLPVVIFICVVLILFLLVSFGSKGSLSVWPFIIGAGIFVALVIVALIFIRRFFPVSGDKADEAIAVAKESLKKWEKAAISWSPARTGVLKGTVAYVALIALFWFLLPDIWHAWRPHVAFWISLIVGLAFAAWYASKRAQMRKKILYRNIIFVFLVAIGLGYVFSFYKPGEIIEIGEREILKASIEEGLSKKPEMVGKAQMWLEWPKGMNNLLYKDACPGPWDAEVLVNDEYVFQFVTFSCYGGKLADYIWTKDALVGHGWWEDKGTPTGRKPDIGGWQLTPTDTPGLYIGTWWSDKQTGGRKILMKLQMQP